MNEHDSYVWPMRHKLTRYPFLLLVAYIVLPVIDVRDWAKQNLGTVLIAAALFALGFWLGRR